MKRCKQKIIAAIALTSVAHTVLAGVITVPLGSSVQTALNAGKPGDTISLAAGTFTESAPLTVRTGETLAGAGPYSTHLVFTLGSADSTSHGLVVDGNAINVMIRDMDVYSNRGDVKLEDGSAYGTITLQGLRLQAAGGQTSHGVDVDNIYQSVPVNGFDVEWCYLHDSTSDRNWETWGDKNSHFDHDEFFNVHDGGHTNEPTLNNTISWDYSHHVCRMFQEVQGSGKGESGLVMDHDVAYDHPAAYNDSEGVSLCPNWTTGCVVSNCYFRQDAPEGFGAMTGGAIGGPNRLGYAGESIAPNALWYKDTFVLTNESADAIQCGEPCTVQGCVVYGAQNALWGALSPNDGVPSGAQGGAFTYGTGTLINVVNTTLAGAPNPPPNTFAGVDVYLATHSGTTWTPSYGVATSQPATAPSTPVITQPSSPTFTITAGSITTSTAVLSLPTGFTGALHVFTPNGASDCGTLQVSNVGSAQVGSLNSLWQYEVAAYSTNVPSLGVGSVTFTTSPPASPDGTVAKPAVLVKPPASQPSTSAAPTTTHVITVKSDGSVGVQ